MITRPAAVAAALAAVAVGAVVWAYMARPAPAAQDFGATASVGDAAPRPAATVGPISAGVVAGDVPVRSSAPEAAASIARTSPVRVQIPAVAVDVAIEPTGLAPDGSLALPEDAATAVWYRHGGLPGESGRAALIAAHVASRVDGVGPFASLYDVRAGDRVDITMSDGSVGSFVIVRRQRISKEVVDYDAVLGSSTGELVLVTCGGSYDTATGHFDDNVIVWAVPTEVQ